MPVEEPRGLLPGVDVGATGLAGGAVLEIVGDQEEVGHRGHGMGGQGIADAHGAVDGGHGDAGGHAAEEGSIQADGAARDAQGLDGWRDGGALGQASIHQTTQVLGRDASGGAGLGDGHEEPDFLLADDQGGGGFLLVLPGRPGGTGHLGRLVGLIRRGVRGEIRFGAGFLVGGLFPVRLAP